MTREEAIDYNKNLRMYMKLSDKNQPCKFLEENYIALDMAIKALEQEPCDDAISRQAVLDTLDTADKFLDEDRTVERYKAMLTESYEVLSPVKTQEPCEDAIRRDELLKAMDTWDKFGYTETGCFVREPKNDYVKYIHYDDVIKCIKGMPSVTPQPKMGRWIPVGERMPEDSELVLFSTKTDRVFEGRYFADNTDRQWYSFRDDAFAWNNVVTAWMPLPEPYKAESENEK